MPGLSLLVDIVGWAGGALILGAYVLLSTGRLTGWSPIYQWMNVFGSIGFAINSGWHGAMPSVALNVIWMGTALYALWRMRRRAA